MHRALIAPVVVLAGLACGGCGSADAPGVADRAQSVSLPSKTLGIVADPKTGAILAETGSGVFVLPQGTAATARKVHAVLVADGKRVAIDELLTVAYTVDGQLVGSSHPNQSGAGVPADLGLLVSGDGGRTWRPRGLYGTADPHILRPAGSSVYAVNFAKTPFSVLTSDDHGHTWSSHDPPGYVTDIAVDPEDPKHALAITDHGLLVTRDEADSWRPAGSDASALAWAAGGPLYLGDKLGSIRASTDAGATTDERGTIATGVLSLTVGPRGRLWALGADRAIRVSTDGGRRWTIRYHLRERDG